MDGEWEPAMIDNPDYKGEWRPRRIPNPAYKGEWKAKQIANPEYYEVGIPVVKLSSCLPTEMCAPTTASGGGPIGSLALAHTIFCAPLSVVPYTWQPITCRAVAGRCHIR